MSVVALVMLIAALVMSSAVLPDSAVLPKDFVPPQRDHAPLPPNPAQLATRCAPLGMLSARLAGDHAVLPLPSLGLQPMKLAAPRPEVAQLALLLAPLAMRLAVQPPELSAVPTHLAPLPAWLCPPRSWSASLANGSVVASPHPAPGPPCCASLGWA